jgi:hypothetical protein
MIAAKERKDRRERTLFCVLCGLLRQKFVQENKTFRDRCPDSHGWEESPQENTKSTKRADSMRQAVAEGVTRRVQLEMGGLVAARLVSAFLAFFCGYFNRRI